jgi:hypothetical protein
LGADGDDVVEDAGVIAEILFPIANGTGGNVGGVFGDMSSLFFLRLPPPKTRFNLDPALPEAAGTTGDDGGPEG